MRIAPRVVIAGFARAREMIQWPGFTRIRRR
jgi:hypothetical protein